MSLPVLSMWQSWLLVLALAVLAQGAAWWHAQRHRDATLVDAVWAFGVGSAALLLAALGSGAPLPRVLLALLGGLWGLRLGLHLARRAHGKAEDGRYARLREIWGDAPAKWFAMFMVQAGLIALFALPLLPVAAQPQAGWQWHTVAAVLLAVSALAGEATADAQLARFRNNPANTGKVCKQGLWRYSRHPNYFFEWLFWCAWPLLAIGAPLAWLAWLGPVLMYVFLRYLSGIPHTEAQSLRSRGDAYRQYQQETSIFFPWFVRSRP